MGSMTRRSFLLASLATVAYTACAPSGQPSAPAKSEPSKPADAAKPAEAPKAAAPAQPAAEPASKIVFWHAMTASNGEAVNRMVEAFNKSQSKITVEAAFQGNYDDALAKLKTALASNSAPALIQVYDIGQRFMIDSGEIVPIQDFIDRDQFDVSDLEPAVLNYYKVTDKLYSMPFNASSAILYYNKDAFKEAGLDPA